MAMTACCLSTQFILAAAGKQSVVPSKLLIPNNFCGEQHPPKSSVYMVGTHSGEAPIFAAEWRWLKLRSVLVTNQEGTGNEQK
jgi:hypothetical protein